MKSKLLTLITVFSILPATYSFADSSPFQFYLGAQAGGTFSNTKFQTNSYLAGASLEINKKSNDNFIMGGIFAGFRYFFDTFYAGFELEANFDGLNIKAEPLHPLIGDPWKIELKRRYQFIPSAVFGYKITEQALVYIKLGMGISGFLISEGRNQPTEKNIKRLIINFMPAIGFEQVLNKYISARLEVSGELLGGKIRGNSSDAGGEVYQITKTDYTSTSVKLGFVAKI